MKNYVKGILKSKMEDQPRSEPPDNDDGGGGGGAAFLGEDGAMHMIFGGSPVRPSRRREKLIR
jgi:hypothetical protein